MWSHSRLLWLFLSQQFWTLSFGRKTSKQHKHWGIQDTDWYWVFSSFSFRLNRMVSLIFHCLNQFKHRRFCLSSEINSLNNFGEYLSVHNWLSIVWDSWFVSISSSCAALTYWFCNDHNLFEDIHSFRWSFLELDHIIRQNWRLYFHKMMICWYLMILEMCRWPWWTRIGPSLK